MDPECICPEGNYLRSCPYTFEQGGRILHSVGGIVSPVHAEGFRNNQRELDSDPVSTGIEGVLDSLGLERRRSMRQDPNTPPSIQFTGSDVCEPLNFQGTNRHYWLRGKNIVVPREIAAVKEEEDDDVIESMKASHRASMKRFEPLKVNGQSITQYTIGGYEIDIPKTQEKMKVLSPLPPSALPKIFVDNDLNFYHHFFKAMELLFGKYDIEEIVHMKKHEGIGNYGLLCGLIKMLESKIDPDDTALMILMKKVLCTTFEKSTVSNGNGEENSLRVATNLFGFQYIEPGMILHGADVGMWLSMCYSHYRTAWFNTFKSSGVPSFASDGSREAVLGEMAKKREKSLTDNQIDSRSNFESRHLGALSDLHDKRKNYRKRPDNLQKKPVKKHWYD